jgi:hypothetical protein
MIDPRLEQIARKQAVSVAANLRQAAYMLKIESLQNVVDGNDKGRSYVHYLTQAILTTLTEQYGRNDALAEQIAGAKVLNQAQKAHLGTLSLKRDVA